jgi:hypothetical protein
VSHRRSASEQHLISLKIFLRLFTTLAKWFCKTNSLPHPATCR